VEDASDLAGTRVERTRVWDSCFTLDFSHVHGGNSRPTVRARYRQWLTHKLASWKDQFGTLGCVGCGRCITWCPVGIELTEEVKALREKAA
jgi:ferredoxin